MASVAYQARYDVNGPSPYHAVSASLEEMSPIKKATRPTRQRSSSTALTSVSFVRSASASDVGSARAGPGLLRPRLPDFIDGLRKNSLEGDEDVEDGLREWVIADSDSPASRPSLDGFSSRSSTSPNNQSSSNTSPEIAPRRSFKRSVTVPSRPRIPGSWGEGGDKPAPNREGSPLDSAQESNNNVLPPVPKALTSSAIRRPYVTPVAASRTYRSTGGTQPQSLLTNRYLVAENASTPSSSGSSPGSDIPPVPRQLPHSSYQSRVLPSSTSASRLAVPRTTALDGKELNASVRTHSSHSDSDLFDREGSPAHPDHNYEKELQNLQDLVLMSDEETSQPSPNIPTDTTIQRQKRKEPDADESSSSRSSPDVAPKMPTPPSGYPPIPPIPPYRGVKTQAGAVSTGEPGHQRSVTHGGQALATVRSSIEPLSGNSVARMANGLRLVSDSQSNRLGSSRYGYDRMGKVSPVDSRHKRSPTAPSPQTHSSFGPHNVLGKENRVANASLWDGRAPRDRERHMLDKDIPPLPTFIRSAPLDKDRLFAKGRWESEGEPGEQRVAQSQPVHERELEGHDRDREREKELREQQERERERLEKGEADKLAEQEAIAAKNTEAAKAAPLAAREQKPSKPQAGVSADRPAPPPPGGTLTEQRGALQAAQARRILYVRKKTYTKLQCVGRGGSSRVYRVLDENNDIYAIKRVTLERADAETIQGYQNEIQLLNRLNGQPGIIKLIDFESNVRKNTIMLVLECGEIDFATLLAQRVGEKFYQPQVACAWRQMLQAVHVIHEEKIVHSDLKPANFVMVKGVLKLIDFGIAKAIANDTTNIQRDQQIGTVNYMSPEAIEDTQRTDGKKVMKLGRASDVWSLGCILYQMVYGRPPFHSLGLYPKMKAIPDPNHIIEYPEYTAPLKLGGADKPDIRLEHLATKVSQDVINSVKMCLVRDPKKRGSIPELLSQAWVEGSTDLPSAIPLPSTPPQKSPLLREDESIMTQKNMLQLLRYMRTLEGTKPENDEELSKELFANLKQVARQL